MLHLTDLGIIQGVSINNTPLPWKLPALWDLVVEYLSCCWICNDGWRVSGSQLWFFFFLPPQSYSKSQELVPAYDFLLPSLSLDVSLPPNRDPEPLRRWRLLVLNARCKASHNTATAHITVVSSGTVCEPFADCLPWRLVWHARVLSGPCCPCCVLQPPALASSCPTGCWGHRWTSLCPLAHFGGAPTRWGMKRGRPRWCWSSAGATPPSTASRVWSGGSAQWWRAWDAASSCWWRSQLSWAAASLTSSRALSAVWPVASSLLEVRLRFPLLLSVCVCVFPAGPDRAFTVWLVVGVHLTEGVQYRGSDYSHDEIWDCEVFNSQITSSLGFALHVKATDSLWAKTEMFAWIQCVKTDAINGCN